MAKPENTFLWLEDGERYIKRRVSLEELSAMVAELIVDRIAAELNARAPEKRKAKAASDSK